MNASRVSIHDPMPRVAEVCRGDSVILAVPVARFVAAGCLTRDTARRIAAFDGPEDLPGAVLRHRAVPGDEACGSAAALH